MSRTIRNGKTAAYEMVVLREEGERLAYEAPPSGQKPATIQSTRISPNELVFENPAHDFPQEVGYRLKGDTLLGWIRGIQKGSEQRVEFPYKRTRCSGR